MQQVRINITDPLTAPQMFFLQKSLELLHRDTIDTYRLRINNPRTLLRELSQVLVLIKQGSIKELYAAELINEALVLFKEEEELNFISISKKYLLSLIGSNKWDKDKLYYVANVLVNENTGYADELFQNISREIARVEALPNFVYQEYDKLNRLIGYFYIELKSMGYSKEYLHRFLRSIFSPRVAHQNFGQPFDIVRTLIAREKEEFSVYAALKLPMSLAPEDISSEDFEFISYTDIDAIADATNRQFKTFVRQNSEYSFFKITIQCTDYLSAGYVARGILQTKLDLLFMGLSSDEITVNKKCFVVGTTFPQRGNNQYFNYQLDGRFISNITTYNAFLEKLNDMNSRPVDNVSLSKLQAGLRYLRLGSYSDELEGKLLNYWIAIEYLFSANTGGDKVARLVEYYTKIHSLSYAVKIFQYIHKSVQSLELDTVLTHYNQNDLDYLINPLSIIELSSEVVRFPLFVYRLQTLNARFQDHNRIKSELERHGNNLRRNLLRIYRVRNEIVHNAAKDTNIIEITSHIRYYLTFIINGFLDFIINHPLDADQDGKLSIDDYFMISGIRLDSLINSNSATISDLLDFQNPLEYLS
ncbi:hypothetical protein SAMN05660841_04266 [Sphingobacterium nematocida]|uniref:Apea-like HEPN domain-containing protein n=1 Tax=Sphingobacterium nematocida TaxID=1513896 RepID=A0A1T5GQF9_9SPHI|nr:hypothetical protein [Sphingobacterium nematocida]SKC10611.1 hypothetical protein SAMN05660841_04266 [Sphingobacterium nematocida]